MAEKLCPVCGKGFVRLDRHLAKHAGTATTAAAERALREARPPGIRAPHECLPGGCDLVLILGPTRPRGEPSMRGDRWAAMSDADQLAYAFGSLEAAERAWRAHRAMLVSLDRDQLDRAARAGWSEQAPPPVAAGVFEPGAPWPPGHPPGVPRTPPGP